MYQEATIKIYIASKFESAPRIRREAAQLQAKGHRIVSTWTNEVVSREEADAIPQYREQAARRDVEEVLDADLFIIDTLDESNTGGRDVELGIMLARRSMVSFSSRAGEIRRVGPARNIFHSLIPETTWAHIHKDAGYAYVVMK